MLRRLRLECRRGASVQLTVALLALGVALPFSGLSGCDGKPRGTDMLSLSGAERQQKFRDDLHQLRRYDEGLGNVLAYASTRVTLFPDSVEAFTLSPDEREELNATWRAVLDYMWAIDGIKAYWRDVYRLNPVTRRRDHARAFMVGYAAWMIQYKHGLQLVDMTIEKPALETLLDESSVEHGIPADSYKVLKKNVISVRATGRLHGSRGYAKTLDRSLSRAWCAEDEICRWAQLRTTNYHTQSSELLKRRGLKQYSYNTFDVVRDFGFGAWFPVQAGVAEWMGDTKVRRLHKHLVSPAQLDEMQAQLEPADVIVARHNWYLSNVGLPGFWPHAELYLGTWKELETYFDDPEVKAYVATLNGDHPSLPAYLEAHHGDAWLSYRSTAEDGTPYRVIEAVSEGVVFSSLHRACGADYVGVMRPRYSKVDKARAVIEAFEYWGRPYDFNFDFLTDESLVCTELVYKSWQPAEGKGGPDLELVKVMGRPTLPANDIVRQFDEGYGGEGAMFDFVYFLDGREKEKRAEVADVEAFRASWKRPKWDVLQK